jgi:hypothetical protein
MVTRMDFSMAIGANQYALIQLLPYATPRTRQSSLGQTEILLCLIQMMKFQSCDLALVATNSTLTSLVLDCLLTKKFPSFFNSVDQIHSSVSIGSIINHIDMVSNRI